MVGWLCPKTDPSEDVGEQSGNPEETAWAWLFLDRRSHKRQWNLYLCSSDTVSGAAHNKPLTGTDRQTPRLDRKGRREEETITGRQSVLYFLFFFTSLLWRRWRNNLRLLSNCQVLPCGKSLHYVICEALEPWIKRQTQCRRQTETRDQTVTLLPVTAQRPPYLQRRRCSWHPIQPPNPSPSRPLKRIRSSKYIRSPQEASPNRPLSRLNIKDKKKRSSAFEGSPGAYGK